MNLIEKIVVLHRALSAGDVPHAFGGALALAWCTQRPRATIDIDVNLFVPATSFASLVALLPPGIEVTEADLQLISDDGQARLWWDATPVDVFCNTTPFHDEVASRARVEAFGGAEVPFLACRDLAVFKAFFDRTKDWADLEEMQAAGSLDRRAVLGVLAEHLGGDDHRVARLRSL